MTKAQIGQLGEQAACELLKSKGYTIVARNYHTRRGEVDIIAANDEYIAFVEVKTRKEKSMVSPEEAINAAKQKKICLAAVRYLMDNPTDLQPRFDAVSVIVTPAGEIMTFEHLENAFTAEVCDEIF